MLASLNCPLALIGVVVVVFTNNTIGLPRTPPAGLQKVHCVMLVHSGVPSVDIKRMKFIGLVCHLSEGDLTISLF